MSFGALKSGHIELNYHSVIIDEIQANIPVGAEGALLELDLRTKP